MEKKHIAIGPNKGKIDNVEPPVVGGDGPNRKFVKGDAMAVIGEMINVTVSITGYCTFYFTYMIHKVFSFYSIKKDNNRVEKTLQIYLQF